MLGGGAGGRFCGDVSKEIQKYAMVNFYGFQNACERPGVKSLGLHILFYSSWDQRPIEVWPQVFKAFPSFLTTACLIGPKLLRAHQLLTVGNWVSNRLKPCLLMGTCCCCCFQCLSVLLAPQPRVLLAIHMFPCKVTPFLVHQTHLADAWHHLSWSAWALAFLKAVFGASIYLIWLFIYLLLICLWATGGDNSNFSEIFKLLESYEAAGSASWSLSFLFFFLFISHLVFKVKNSPL